MNEDAKEKARQTLTQYLEMNGHRKTPERYAILDAVYSFKESCSLEKVNEVLAARRFQVSRATLYNAMRLFARLGLVVRLRLQEGTRYEPALAGAGRCHLICTVCGRKTDTSMPAVDEAMAQARFRRFRMDSFGLYVYGICSNCLTRIRKKDKTNQLQQYEHR